MCRCLVSLLTVVCLFSASAAITGRGSDMDYGPFLNYTVQLTNEVVTKGVTVKLSVGTQTGTLLFDTETLRYAAGWTDGWLDLSKTHLTTYKGELPPRAVGHVLLTNVPGAGIDSAGKYRGFYRHGSNVVFRYAIGGTDMLDMPGMEIAGSKVIFTRALDELSDVQSPGSKVEGRRAAPSTLDVGLRSLESRGGKPSITRRNLDPLCHGGPALWPQILTTSGRRGDDSTPFAVDTIAVPENNPWRSWMRLTAFDFFSDGRAAVTTWNGDVWIVSGIDEQLKSVKWKRLAAGLFDPLGLKIVRDEVYVLERHQITRLHDLNNDGEADYYENFNNDAGVSPSYHAFAMDLQTDSAGNFYYTRAGQRVDEIYPLNGGMVRVSANGAKAELIAHGLRAANGMSVGPRDEITCSDNQGNWIPSGRLNLIEPGKFYGYVPHAHGLPTNSFEPPLCWIPQALDNSGGGQAWVTSDRWPPALKNHLLHTSYGMAALFDVLWEKVDGVAQGGVVKFPLRFESGIQRARFHPRDGQLYVVGLKGWQTKGIKDGAFQRVRYTGKPLHMPSELHVRRNGIEIGFSDSLERGAAEDLQNYSVEQWNYRWTEKYGSDDYSVVDPEKKGRDVVNIGAAKLSADGKRVLLEIPDLKPVMQMKIKFAVKATDGAPVEWEIYNTINRVPK